MMSAEGAAMRMQMTYILPRRRWRGVFRWRRRVENCKGPRRKAVSPASAWGRKMSFSPKTRARSGLGVKKGYSVKMRTERKARPMRIQRVGLARFVRREDGVEVTVETVIVVIRSGDV